MNARRSTRPKAGRANLAALATAVACASLALAALATPPSVAAQGPFEPPDVVGRQIDDAERALADWNQEYWDGTARIEWIPDPVERQVDRGFVIVVDQAPATDEQPPLVTVWRGVEVPDLLGRSLDEAVEELAVRGLRAAPGPREALGDWLVADQGPSPGEPALLGDTVELLLESPDGGPPDEPGSILPTDGEPIDLLPISLLVAVVVVLAIVALARRPGRQPTDRSPHPPVIRTLNHPDLAPEIEVREIDR